MVPIPTQKRKSSAPTGETSAIVADAGGSGDVASSAKKTRRSRKSRAIGVISSDDEVILGDDPFSFDKKADSQSEPLKYISVERTPFGGMKFSRSAPISSYLFKDQHAKIDKPVNKPVNLVDRENIVNESRSSRRSRASCMSTEDLTTSIVASPQSSTRVSRASRTPRVAKPAILSEAERMNVDLDTCRAQLQKARDDMSRVAEERDRLKAELKTANDNSETFMERISKLQLKLKVQPDSASSLQLKADLELAKATIEELTIANDKLGDELKAKSADCERVSKLYNESLTSRPRNVRKVLMNLPGASSVMTASNRNSVDLNAIIDLTENNSDDEIPSSSKIRK